MASPQKEHGFTPYATELYRALIKQNLSGHEWRVLGAIAIDTYGRSRKETVLSIKEIASMTDLERSRAAESIGRLVVRKIVLPGGSTEKRTGSKIVRKINKDYDTWGSTENRTSTEKRTTPSTENRTTHHRLTTVRAGGIDGVNVNTIRKKNTNTPAPDGAVVELISLFHLKLTEALGEKPPTFNGGALGRFFKAALRSHPREDIERRIEAWFASTDTFFVSNGYSPTLFTSKFPLLKGGPIHANSRPNNRPANSFVASSEESRKYDDLGR